MNDKWSEWIVHYHCLNCNYLVKMERIIMSQLDGPEEVFRLVTMKQQFHNCEKDQNIFGVIAPTCIRKKEPINEE